MSKKSQKKKHNPIPVVAKASVRISQCMIVKNEEKNIEKALHWGKTVAFEQIVVDTGSTDRTVEIAEALGAKVYHFDWIDDFGAAKNFAIERATGNWIAFLDADEYFPDEDVKYILPMLSDPLIGKTHDAIMCSMLQLGSDGKAFAVLDHVRIFRNKPEIRYKGRIHEILTVPVERIVRVSNIRIVHTGYTASAHKDAGKSERNLRMLRKEIEIDPDDPNLMVYLADSLRIEPDEQKTAEADELYMNALKSERPLFFLLEKEALGYAFSKYINDTERADEIEPLCIRAIENFPDDIDYQYYYAVHLNCRGNHEQAWNLLIESEKRLNAAESLHVSTLIVSKPILLFLEMARTAQRLGKASDLVHYSILTLKEDKYQKGVLAPLLQLLSRDENTSDEDIFGLLGRLYDFGDKKDRAFILVCSKMAGNRTVFDMTRSLFSADEIERLKIPEY